jgi:hypothetical protein
MVRKQLRIEYSLRRKPLKRQILKPASDIIAPMEHALVADGFEEAFIGTVERLGGQPDTLAVYSIARCLEVLERQGMSHEEAHEYLEFNVLGAHAGPGTPLFLDDSVTLDQFHFQADESATWAADEAAGDSQIDPFIPENTNPYAGDD